MIQQDQNLVVWLGETDLRCAKNRNTDSKNRNIPTLTFIHLANHSARFSSIDLVSVKTSHSSMHDQTPCQSQLSSSHHLLHLVTSPSLQLLSDHHFSHTSLASSVTALTHLRQRPAYHLLSSLTSTVTCSGVISHLYHQL